MSGLSKKDWGKGPITTLHSAISSTATATEYDASGFNAVLMEVLITGTGAWTVKVQGRFNTSGTVMDIYDNNGNQLTTGSLSASRMVLFVAVPDLITVVATEDSGTATCTVRIQPINI